MGMDYYYLGLPADAEVLRTFRENARIAEDILQSLLMNILHSRNFKNPLWRKIESEYPDIDTWRYEPTWRASTAWAMIKAIDNDIGAESSGRTIGERIVLGDELFWGNEPDLYLANLFRITSPQVVKKYAEFWLSYDMKSLDENYRHGALELAEYFQKVASIGNLSIICMNL